MGIEKMKYVDIVGAREVEHIILEEIILSGQAQISVTSKGIQENNYRIHEYQTTKGSECISEAGGSLVCIDKKAILDMIEETKELSRKIGCNLYMDKESIRGYTKELALEDYSKLQAEIGPHLDSIVTKEKEVKKLELLYGYLEAIDENIDFEVLNNLTHIEYKIGTLTKENRRHVNRNKENISSLIMQIGENTADNEKIYIAIYPTLLSDETNKILKSLNFKNIIMEDIPYKDLNTYRQECFKKIGILRRQIKKLEEDLVDGKSEITYCINKIHTRLLMEMKIWEVMKSVSHNQNVFSISFWTRGRDVEMIKSKIGKVTDKYSINIRNVDEVTDGNTPPTKLKNSSLFSPFEMLVRLYGLPQYKEIDPTPFLAITFCLMFGIMFGDIGQGFIYFLAGILINKKMELAGGILRRLGVSSMIFGVIYGSVFGLEHLPIISDIALVKGGPLHGDNIMNILIMGVVFGVTVLSMAFFIGILNFIKRRDFGNLIFGKNGLCGYVFFMGLVFIMISLLQVIELPLNIPFLVMAISLILMILKEPLVALIRNRRPLIEGDKGSYFIENGFEGVETILSTLSNTISFIRVGAFALNHAGLFLAFLQMSNMVSSLPLKILILIIGNILILTLEGLVVFIQGLRLEYYELFSKYFKGGGVEFESIKLQ